MEKRFYLVKMVAGIEPDLSGPYPTEARQEESLIEIVKGDQELGPDGHGSIFWLDIDEGGVASVNTYHSWYMKQVWEAAGYEVSSETPRFCPFAEGER